MAHRVWAGACRGTPGIARDRSIPLTRKFVV